MKCKNCEYCEYVEHNGHNCRKWNVHIPLELLFKDIDCMVYDYGSVSKEIFVNSEGCKDIKTSYHTMKTF